MSQVVENALNEVLQWVGVGAAALEVSPDTQIALKNAWRPDFKEQLLCQKIVWSEARETVLDLAEQVGSYARILTLGKWSAAGGALPSEIDEACAMLAGYMVASTSQACIRALRLGVRGAFCRGFPNPAGGALATEIDNLIRPLPKHDEGPDSERTNVQRKSA